MEVTVQGRGAHLEETDRAAIEERVVHAARVFEQAVDRVDVEVTEEANPRRSNEKYRIEVTTFVAGRIVRVESAASTRETALDDVIDLLTRRMRKLKGRIIDRSRRREEPSPSADTVESDEIVRVKQFVMKPMTVQEAALQMEMLDHSFFFFHNVSTGLQSVLYRRRDGRLGLIEPAS